MFGIKDAFVDTLKSSPIGQSILREQAEQAAAARRVIFDKRQAAMQARVALTAKHEKAVAPLRASRDADAEKLARSDAKLAGAQRIAQQELAAVAAEVDRLTRTLIADASPRIIAARVAIWARYEANRDTLARGRAVESGARDAESGKPVMRHESNQKAIRRLLEAMRQASNRLDAMAVEAYEDVDATIAEVLQPLEAAWSAVNTLEA